MTPQPAIPIPTDHAEAVRRFTEAAKGAGSMLSTGFVEAAKELARQARDVASFGEMVPPGIRDEARQIADDLTQRADRMTAIMGRIRG